ncbi:MAG TPA: hypothetical protein DIW46_12930 [Microbacterium sp.]|nr:hypothetical protein [Microbacterium sp.]
MKFLKPLMAASLAAALAACTTTAGPTALQGDGSDVGFQLIRNATIKLDYAGTTFLIDPMLAEKGRYPGFEGTLNSHLRNPLVDLPMTVADAMKADAVVITHTHLDHWDDVAKQQLPKSIPIFVQNEQDAASVRKDGFSDVRVLGSDTVFNGTRLVRTGGQHGTDAHMAKLGAALGTVSGIIFERQGHETVYVAGDTIWRPEVEAAVQQHRPDVVVLNTGFAVIPGIDGAIIMGKEDLERARQLAPDAVVVGVHMDAVNHAGQSRRELREFIAEKKLDPARTRVPEDGESYRF